MLYFSDTEKDQKQIKMLTFINSNSKDTEVCYIFPYSFLY